MIGATLAIGTIAGCSSQPTQTPVDHDVVATVEGEEIPASWYRQTYFDFLVKTGGNDTPGNQLLHLDNLIDALLLGHEANRRGFGDDSAATVFVARETKKALGLRFYEENFLERMPALTEAEIRQAFLKWKTQVVVRHLFYTHPDSAQAAYARLQSGSRFLEEARRCYGLAAVDSSAGYLGSLRYFMIDDAFAETAFNLEVGTYSEPVQSRFGYHIILLEDRIRSPLLTEAEYQTRKKGIAKRAKLRKIRLEGDRFVRDYMSQFDVRVNSPAVVALRALTLESEKSVEPKFVTLLGPEAGGQVDASSMLAALDLDTPLATYLWRNEPRVFTLQDYFFWLPDLPYDERRTRTGASVGRALRNAVFAMEGEENNLGDSRIEAAVRRKTLLFAARRLLTDLRADTTAIPTDEQLREAFERSGPKISVTADFWMLPFDSMEEARRARGWIVEEGADPEGMDGFTRGSDVSLSSEPPELAYYVRQSPIDEVNVVGLAGGVWIVLKVTRKESEAETFESAQPQLVERLRPHIREYELLRTLRERAEISVDSLLFRQVLELE